MELSFTYAPSPSPHKLKRFNHGVFTSHFTVSTPFNHSHGANSSSNAFRIRKSVPVVKASLNSSSLRHTLSGNWDVLDNYSASSAPSLARFEELDTTNMLLRQRIIFLGSQAISRTISWFLNYFVLLCGVCWILSRFFIGLNCWVLVFVSQFCWIGIFLFGWFGELFELVF